MNQLEYIPGIGGASVQMDGPESFVGIAENLRSRKWEYNLGYRDIVSATRPAREVDTTFYADFATADDLRRVADADVMAATPGIFVAQKEWRQRGYILASQPNDIHYGRLTTELKIALLDGAWWRLVKRSFVPEITTPEYRSATGETVTASGASGAPLHALTVDGESVQDGTPTPSNPVAIQVVGPVNGSFGINVNGTVTTIDLQGNVLASLPDGTKDVLTVDSAGHVVLEKRVNKYTIIGNESIWNTTNLESVYRFNIAPSGLNAFAGDVAALSDCLPGATGYGTNTEHVYTNASRIWLYISNTYNTAADALAAVANSNVYYKLATPQTIDLGTIDMPAIPLDAQISVTAALTPTISAEWQISRDAYLDYPHNYPHDYQATSSTADVTPSVLTPSDVYLVVYGPAVNPYVIVGGNRYQVNVTVPAGGYLIVDGREKTITLILANGTAQNAFPYGVRGSGQGSGTYIFEPLQPGSQEVTFSGDFGFDFGWYEEEGEPPWNQS